MKILFLCNKNPYSERDGGCLAMNVMIKEAVRCGHYVKVLAVNSKKNFVDINTISEDYKSATHYENVYLNLGLRPLLCLTTLLSGKSPHLVRFDSKRFRSRLKDILQETNFDVIRIESIFLCGYLNTIKEYSHGVIDLRTHNIEHIIWERLYSSEKNILKKLFLHHVAKTLKKYEYRYLSDIQHVSAITMDDLQWIRKNISYSQIDYVPFGMDLTKIVPIQGVDIAPNSVFFIGAMDWMPNIEGVNWFFDNVCELLLEKAPEIKIYLAGRSMPKSFFEKHPENVVVVGEVKDAHVFMSSKDVMVVPLLSGGGVRIKIIEGLAMAKPIVTTTIGAEGTTLRSGVDAIIADKPDDMADGIVKLVRDRQLNRKISNNALSASKQYDIRTIFAEWVVNMNNYILKDRAL